MSHFVTRFYREPKRANKIPFLEFLLSIGGSADDIVDPDATGHYTYGQDRKVSVVDFAAFKGNEDVFDLLLQKSNEYDECYCLSTAVHSGKIGIIESLQKKRIKREKAMLMRKQTGPILDLACSSKHLSIGLIESLLKICPDIVYNNYHDQNDSKSPFESQLGISISWGPSQQKTTLAKLLSPDHPLRKKSEIERVARFLIEQGICLENKDADENGKPVKHFACDAYFCAVRSRYYRIAALILEKAGKSLWKCAINGGKCEVEKELKSDKIHGAEDVWKEVSGLMKHLGVACNRTADEIWLKMLIQSGKKYLAKVSYSGMREKYSGNETLKTIAEKVDNPTCKELLFFVKLAFGSNKVPGYNLLRLVKFIPTLYPYIVNLKSPMWGGVDLSMFASLEDCTEEDFLLNKCLQRDMWIETTFPTLLHAVCRFDNVRLVEDVLTAAFHININTKNNDGLKPIDIAAMYGRWNVYKTLAENGAKITKRTLRACTQIRHHMHSLQSEKAKDKEDERERLKIIQDICDRGVNFQMSYVVCNIFSSRSWEIVRFFTDKYPLDIASYLVDKKHVYCTRILYRYGPESLVQSVIDTAKSNKLVISVSCIGEMVLAASFRDTKTIIMSIVNDLCSGMSSKEMTNALSQFDKNHTSVVQNVTRKGFFDVIQLLGARIGSFKELDKFYEDKNVDSPLWYALCNQQWDVANYLLMFDCNPILRRAVPDLLTKGRFTVSFKMPQKYLNEINALKRKGVPVYHWEYIKPFPTMKNVSHTMTECIAPGIPCFDQRNKQYKCKRTINRNIMQVKRVKLVRNQKESRFETMRVMMLSKLAKRYDCSLIHVACATGDIELVKQLVKHRPEILSVRNNRGLLPIIFAVAGGKEEIVKAMKITLDSSNAVELIKVCLWKILMLKGQHRNPLAIPGRNRIDSVIDHLKPLVPKQDESEKDGKPMTVQKERVIAIIEMLKQAHETVCTENIYGADWCSIARLESEKTGGNLTEETIKSILMDAIQNIEIRKLQPIMWIAILASDPWVTKAIISIWSNDEAFLSKINGKFFGEFSLIDMIIICAECDNEERKSNEESSVSQIYKVVVSNVLSLASIPVKEDIIEIAVKKNLWAVLEEIATKQVQTVTDITPIWYNVMIACISKSQNLSFFKALTEKMELYKLDDTTKREFHAFECLACLYGRDDVIRYLFKCNIPIGSTTKDLQIMKMCSRRYPDNWNVLHYAVKGGSEKTFDLILRFLKYHVSCLQSTDLSELLSLAFSQRVQPIQDKLMAFLQKHMKAELTEVNWNIIFLKVVKTGCEDGALRLLKQNEINITSCDQENKNALHFAASQGLLQLTSTLLEHESYRELHVPDQHGNYPIDYAVVLGKTNLIPVIYAKFPLSLSAIFLTDFHGCLRGILEDNSYSCTAQIKPMLTFIPNANQSHSFIETLLRRSDDASASFIIEHCPYVFQQGSYNNTLLHLAARYGCIQSAVALSRVWNEKQISSSLENTFESLTPLAWAVQTKNAELIEIITKMDVKKISLTWKNTKTKETILHLAVKTGCQNIVETIDRWTEKTLRDVEDHSGLSPSALSIALGEQHLLPSLTQSTIDCPQHASHTDDETDFNCCECLLDLGIGWIKCYYQRMSDNNFQILDAIARPIPSTYPSNRAFVPIRRFQYKALGFLVNSHLDYDGKDDFNVRDYYIWLGGRLNRSHFKLKLHILQSVIEWVNFDKTNSLTLSLMTSMGYRSYEVDVVALLLKLEEKQQKSCPPQKLLRSTVADAENNISKYDPQRAYQLFETAASIGNKTLFTKNTELLNALVNSVAAGNIEKTTNHSLCEIAYSFGHSELGLYLQTLLRNSSQGQLFSSFGEISSALPVQLLWILKMQQPGDSNWNIEEEFENEIRLPKSEILLSSKLPEVVLNYMEKDIDTSSIVPPTCRGKTFTPDYESFRKQPHFSQKSDLWIKCFMASSLIYGQAFSVLQYHDAKISSASGLQIRCLQEGSGEHPKTSIEQNGTIVESVGISKQRNGTTLEYDRLPQQRSTDILLKQKILQEVVPDLQQKILEVFGHSITIKIDWRSVESQRRTSGSVSILKMLQKGNRLAGLEDVIDHCREMKDDITDMFSDKTAEFAIMPMSTVHEITVKYVDTLPNGENMPPPKYASLIPNCTWHFTIDRSTLKYDRNLFPPWNQLYLYHGACVSLLWPVKMMSFKESPEYDDHSSEITRFPNLTLEVDIKSFGAYSILSLHRLISRKIEEEASHIAFLLHSMLRLSLSTQYIVIQNTSSTKYTGVNLKGDKLTVSIYAHQHKTNEWIVSSENALASLAELEDKNVLSNISPTLIDDVNGTALEVQQRVTKDTGLQLKISVDERKLLEKIFNRYRREMTHPCELIRRSIDLICYHVPECFNDLFSRIFDSTSATFCRKVSPVREVYEIVSSEIHSLKGVDTQVDKDIPSSLKHPDAQEDVDTMGHLKAPDSRKNKEVPLPSRKASTCLLFSDIVEAGNLFRFLKNRERLMRSECCRYVQSLKPDLFPSVWCAIYPEVQKLHMYFENAKSKYPNGIWRTQSKTSDQSHLKDRESVTLEFSFWDVRSKHWYDRRCSEKQRCWITLNKRLTKVLDFQNFTKNTKLPAGFVTRNDSVYEILDAKAMTDIFSNIRYHEMYHDLIVHALENGFEKSYIYKKLHDVQDVVSEKCLPNITSYQSEKIDNMLTVYGNLPLNNIYDQVSVDWRSFFDQTEILSDSDRFLRNVLDCFINVYNTSCKEIYFTRNESEIPLCELNLELQEVITHFLSSLNFCLRRLKIRDEDNVQNEDIEISFQSVNQFVVGFRTIPDRETLAKHLNAAITRCFEIQILLSIYGLGVENTAEDDVLSKKHSELAQGRIKIRKGSLDLRLAVHLHRNMEAAIATFMELNCQLQEIPAFVKVLKNVNCIKSGVTSMKINNGCLKLLVSPMDLSPNTLIRGLMSVLPEIDDSIPATDTVLFSLAGPEVYFSSSKTNTISLFASDGNGNQLSDLRKEIVFAKKAYQIRLRKNASETNDDDTGKITLHAESVHLTDKGVTICWSGDALSHSGITDIEVLHNGRRLYLPKQTIVLKDCEPLKDVVLSKNDELKIEKDGYVTLFLEHDNDRCMNVHENLQKLSGIITPVKRMFRFYNLDFVNNKCIVRFEVFVRARKFYTFADEPAIRICHPQGARSDFKNVYTLKCVRPTQRVKLRAICKLCGSYLRIVTPKSITEPGQELVIN